MIFIIAAVIVVVLLSVYGILVAYSHKIDNANYRDCRDCIYFGEDGYPCDRCKWINRNAYGDHFKPKSYVPPDEFDKYMNPPRKKS